MLRPCPIVMRPAFRPREAPSTVQRPALQPPRPPFKQRFLRYFLAGTMATAGMSGPGCASVTRGLGMKTEDTNTYIIVGAVVVGAGLLALALPSSYFKNAPAHMETPFPDPYAPAHMAFPDPSYRSPNGIGVIGTTDTLLVRQAREEGMSAIGVKRDNYDFHHCPPYWWISAVKIPKKSPDLDVWAKKHGYAMRYAGKGEYDIPVDNELRIRDKYFYYDSSHYATMVTRSDLIEITVTIYDLIRPDTLSGWIATLQNEDAVVMLRIDATEALGKIGGRRAIEALSSALNDKKEDVRYWAARALEKIKNANKPVK